ncbi:MAG: DNA alkylation repair protein [Treponema sp.]|nr:DNA alkylation repair protein [Treponema sp.]
MIEDDIRGWLQARQDAKYREMQVKILPSLSPGAIVGVRTPDLRKYAKEIGRREDVKEFLESLPHRFFEEKQLHAFIISELKDYGQCMTELTRFLPYVDNWATCDQMSPRVFKKRRQELLPSIREWIASGRCYTVRFGLKMLMEHFLDDDFSPDYVEMAAGIKSDEYYVNMMIAWYFATALAKQYDTVLPFIEGNRLAPWTHNKAIQKAVESYRIAEEQKDYLRSLRRKA